MKQRTTQIQTSHKLQTEIAQHFNCCLRSVRYALSYRLNSDLSVKIRKYALEHGGVNVGNDFIPNCQTRHTAEEMIQEFANDVYVIVNKKSGVCTMKSGSMIVEHIDGTSVREWSGMVARAQQLSEILTVRAM